MMKTININSIGIEKSSIQKFLDKSNLAASIIEQVKELISNYRICDSTFILNRNLLIEADKGFFVYKNEFNNLDELRNSLIECQTPAIRILEDEDENIRFEVGEYVTNPKLLENNNKNLNISTRKYI